MTSLPDALILLGHGSRKAEANEPLFELARMTAEALGGCRYGVAFLQLAEPTLADAVAEAAEAGARSIVVMPFFLFPGAHVTEDIPEELEGLRAKYPHCAIRLAPHLGTHPLLAQVAAERVKETLK